MKTAAEWKRFYNESFEKEYEYDGILGAICSGEHTEFFLWSPVAESVILRLYDTAASEGTEYEFEMQQKERGVWYFAVEKNLCGKYYDYLLAIDGRNIRSDDPYAYSCGVNGRRSMVVDHALASPKDWNNDARPPKQSEDIIYELHIKEFSWDESASFPKGHRGSFLAFTDTGVTVNEDNESPAGIDYLKKLGITHVQIMPMYDFASVDESGAKDQFNWGYDPVNYFVPEGSYSTDPYDGMVRVREAKQMIQALHNAGIRVVMDVVFNHTWSFDNSLQHTMPWYYYRQYMDGRSSNGSGCGNDIASERRMCAKLIKDCMLYWAREYHIDGFRLDLMGLLNVELLNDIKRSLDEIYGEGEILMYGEPWAAAQTVIDYKYLLATKNNLSKLDDDIGYFCDDIRDYVKGSAWHPREAGFVNGGRRLEESVYECLGGFGMPASKIVSYVSCHDNQTLWDKLAETTEYEELRRREYRLAASLYICMPGRILMLSGEEFLRSKDGYSNTYNAPVYLNMLSWRKSAEEADTVSYYAGLIALRKQLWCLYDKGVRRISGDDGTLTGNQVVAVALDNSDSDVPCRWDRVYMVFNSRQSELAVKLPEGDWELLLDGNDSFLWRKHPAVSGEEIAVQPVSAVLLGRV